MLQEAFRYVMDGHSLQIDAKVLLPDHLYRMWSLPAGDRGFSTRWCLIKSYFHKLKIRHQFKSPVPGLYLTGSGVFPGPGIEAVVISGMLAADAVFGEKTD